MAAPYTITGRMFDGEPYAADGEMQPNGSVLFRVPANASVKDCEIVRASSAPTPGEYVIEKSEAA